jgi:hypothetical protein
MVSGEMLGLAGNLNFARCRRRVRNMTLKLFHSFNRKITYKFVTAEAPTAVVLKIQVF